MCKSPNVSGTDSVLSFRVLLTARQNQSCLSQNAVPNSVPAKTSRVCHHHHVHEGLGCFLFLDPQDEVGPSISSSAVLCSFVPLFYILVFVMVVYFCPSSVRVVATFPGIVLFPLLCPVLPFFPLIHWFFSVSSFVIPSKCLQNFICAASKRCSSLFLSTQASLPNFVGLQDQN